MHFNLIGELTAHPLKNFKYQRLSGVVGLVQPGHFEIDTIFGKYQKSFLLTLADKVTRMVIVRKLPNKRAETVVAAFRDIVASTFCDFKTLTADNRSEFAQHEQIT